MPAAASGEPGRQVSAVLPLRAPSSESTERSAPQALPYLLFLPQDYRAEPGRWPLLLFLHGAGERGTDLAGVTAHGPPHIVQRRPDFPMIVASPQCPPNRRWNPAELIQLVDHVQHTYRVDPARVYVTGLSMGGFGTWALCAAYPDRFAAAIPICGGGNPADAPRLQMPIWAFHGALDQVVELKHSQQMVDAIRAAGGDAQLTVYPDVAHHSWPMTYDNPAIYDWLLQHRRAVT